MVERLSMSREAISLQPLVETWLRSSGADSIAAALLQVGRDPLSLFPLGTPRPEAWGGDGKRYDPFAGVRDERARILRVIAQLRGEDELEVDAIIDAILEETPDARPTRRPDAAANEHFEEKARSAGLGQVLGPGLANTSLSPRSDSADGEPEPPGGHAKEGGQGSPDAAFCKPGSDPTYCATCGAFLPMDLGPPPPCKGPGSPRDLKLRVDTLQESQLWHAERISALERAIERHGALERPAAEGGAEAT